MEEDEMRIVFRTDASLQIGSGHVMRCLTLADELRQRGADISFICREHPGHLLGLIADKGYPFSQLPPAEVKYIPTVEDVDHAEWLGVSWQQDAADTLTALGEMHTDWLIIDHYALDRRWEELLRPHVGRVMVIDDLADRPHDCDLLLDQNVYDHMECRYDKLISSHCTKFLGPRYALLRPEFTAAKKDLAYRDGIVNRILVFFGGSDLTNETRKTLLAIQSLGYPDISVDVVVGGANPYQEEIKELCSSLPNTQFYCQVDNMAQLMISADLSIGAGGVTAWERVSLKLPTLAIAVADNQVEGLKLAGRFKWLHYLGLAEEITVDRLKEEISSVMQQNLNGKFVFIEVSDLLNELVDSLVKD